MWIFYLQKRGSGDFFFTNKGEGVGDFIPVGEGSGEFFLFLMGGGSGDFSLLGCVDIPKIRLWEGERGG